MAKKLVIEIGQECFFCGPYGPFEKKRYAESSSRMRFSSPDHERIIYRVVRVEKRDFDSNTYIIMGVEVYKILEEYFLKDT